MWRINQIVETIAGRSRESSIQARRRGTVDDETMSEDLIEVDYEDDRLEYQIW